MPLRTTYSPTAPPGKDTRVMNFAYCLHKVMVIGKYTYVFTGNFSGGGGGGSGGGVYVGGPFHGGIFHRGR